ncbi:MAG: hypothetical protein OXE44_13530 [Nitrospinae bacterium]|nr:hypothetical protein [Nitrospinota bacterium]
MRKLLLALFAMALVVAFTAPSYAADFKYTGFFRIRGIAGNNGDRNDDADDSAQGFDALTRPRFTATTDKGAIWALWEIDWYEARSENDRTPNDANANILFGRSGGRVGVGTNRWVVDFAVPGSALRARWGRTDYTSPDKQIFDSAGGTRWPGLAVYGKLSKNMSLSMFMTRTALSGRGRNIGPEDENRDNYYASVGIKVSPAVTLTPWVALSRDGMGRSLTYAALNAKTKVGIVGLNLSGVSVGGDAAANTDASGWALLASGKASLGKLTLIGTAIMLSGDDNANDGEEGEFANLMPGGGQFISGVMVTDRSTTGGITSFRARLPGAGGTRNTRFQNLNGAVVIGGDAVYKISKTFKVAAGVHIYQSAEDDMEGDTDYGTEFNTGFEWKIYPKLRLRTQFGYLATGDYGISPGDPDDDAWTAMFSLDHFF